MKKRITLNLVFLLSIWFLPQTPTIASNGGFGCIPGGQCWYDDDFWEAVVQRPGNCSTSYEYLCDEFCKGQCSKDSDYDGLIYDCISCENEVVIICSCTVVPSQ